MFLRNPITSLQGVGVKRRPLFERLLGTRVMDALMHLPCSLINRRLVKSVSLAKAGETITVMGEVKAHHPPSYARKPYSVSCFDGASFFDLVFFHAKAPYLQTILPINSKRLISGKLEKFQGRWKITHPDHIADPDEHQKLCGPEPVYPLTTGITNKCVTRVIQSALSQTSALPEWLDDDKARIWPKWHEAIHQAHAPQTEQDLAPKAPARLRLAYDELLAHQLSLRLIRRSPTKREGISLEGNGCLKAQILQSLPFTLTAGQEKAIAEITADMASPHQMVRLIQGDVGSGKTLVALMAMAQAVEAGFQAALLAPTDILARQHLEKLTPLCQTAGIRLSLLTGRDTGKKRVQILEDLKNHEIDILIGTHAIIQEDVHFARLGLAVMDEQHRFGVNQRLALTEKARNPDILAMTATPIPRTLMLANHGDMDISLIPDKPAGRQAIDTKVIPLSRLAEVVAGVERAVKEGASKIYWVCPLIEESEAIDLAAAVERWEALSQLLPGKVGLMHGKLKTEEKESVMEQFINGPVDILISTTVIEVGVDVPAASIMVIEHAERFGLAQLHQLRGRIGRGNQKSTCLLLYGHALTAVGRKRLEMMRQTNDGFLIAEEDLKLRGSGELLGTKQSGLPRFRIADFTSHPDVYGELFALANQDARRICKDDPTLSTPRGQALQLLLSLHDRADAAKYSRSG